MNVTINIPQTLYEQFRDMADAAGMKYSVLVTRLIQKFVDGEIKPEDLRT